MNRMRIKYYLRALGIGIIVTALLMGYSQRGQGQLTDEEILQRAAQLGMVDPSSKVLADLVPPESTDSPIGGADGPSAGANDPTGGMDDPMEGANGGSQPGGEQSPGPKPTPNPAASPTPEPTPSPAISPEPMPGSAASPSPEPVQTPKPTPSPSPEPTPSPSPTPAQAPETSPTPAPLPTVSPGLADSEGDVAVLVVNRGESSEAVSRKLQELGVIESYKDFDRFLCDGGYSKVINTGTHEIPPGATYEEIARIITRSQ